MSKESEITAQKKRQAVGTKVFKDLHKRLEGEKMNATWLENELEVAKEQSNEAVIETKAD